MKKLCVLCAYVLKKRRYTEESSKNKNSVHQAHLKWKKYPKSRRQPTAQ
jgi:hypothetical protein